MKNLKQAQLESASKKWNFTASVRTNPETYDLNLSDNGKPSLSWHLPNYSGILSHPTFSGVTESQKSYIMGIQLLEFTIKQARFEIDCVNKVAANLSQGQYNFTISDEFKIDALKIYTDEGYHALFTQKISDQIREHYKIEFGELDQFIEPHFQKLYSLKDNYDKKYAYLADIAIVLVSENQIVADISDEMKNIVHEPIRLMFKDHMIDETFHAKYFCKTSSHNMASII